MKTIKIKTPADWKSLVNFTGIVEDINGDKCYLVDGDFHREDGPARIYKDENEKIWYLNGKWIWNSNLVIDLTKEILLSKTKHPDYSGIEVWKILDSSGLREQVIIPGMEEYITK